MECSNRKIEFFDQVATEVDRDIDNFIATIDLEINMDQLADKLERVSKYIKGKNWLYRRLFVMAIRNSNFYIENESLVKISSESFMKDIGGHGYNKKDKMFILENKTVDFNKIKLTWIIDGKEQHPYLFLKDKEDDNDN